MARLLTKWLAIGLCSVLLGPVFAAPADAPQEDPLRHGFLFPPDAAKPRVWWHWLDGNVTEEGIRGDLEWMHRVGIGGMQNFDAGYSTPQLVKERLVFMSPPWQEAFRYAAQLADRWGLEFAIASAPGWSESGGPWVRPEEGMKKLVWSEMIVAAGAPFTGKTPHPPTTIGPFQNVPAEGGTSNPTAHEWIREIYKDVAVLAYPVSPNECSMEELHPSITSSAGAIDARLLWDPDFVRAVHLPYGQRGHPAWIRLDFGRPQTLRSMTLGLVQTWWNLLGPHHRGAELQASSDGLKFHTVAIAYDTADASQGGGAEPPVEETVTFAPVTARYFRLQLPAPTFPKLPPNVADPWGMGPKPVEHRVTELILHPTARVDHFEQKAGYFLDSGTRPLPTRHVPLTEAIRRDAIVDLSSRIRPDGTLDWTPPTGRWAILRMGYSLLGVTNHPASSEATGLEVDKLSQVAVKTYMDRYLARYVSMLGPKLMGSQGLTAMVSDSWEAGPQNWTPRMPEEFANRRGYSLIPWLPALTGRIVGSAEETDRFLWDFRRTLGELLTENHYGQISASLHERGMVHYGESHEVSRSFIGDGMDAKRDDDIPMGAMWVPAPPPLYSQEQGDADLRESASVAHLYGQNLVAAESMTVLGEVPGAAFAFAPEDLKSTVDRELADGLNRFVVHTSVHQPLNAVGPGISLGPFGQWFTRQETWAEQAGAWVSYLTRSSYLLQQGHFVADILYYYGQDSNITALYGEHLPPIPEGYAFDFANPDALTRLSVRDGFLVAATGMRYRLLALDPRNRLMSVDVLKRIAGLVQAGAVVVGDRPQATPSLSDSEEEFYTVSNAVWGDGAPGVHRYGKGVILSGFSIARAVHEQKLAPDFAYSKPHPDTTLWFVHRQLTDGELYFVNNRRDHPEKLEARFRVSGRVPELWHADTATIEPVSYRVEGDQTIVRLTLDARDALFVVFREATTQRKRAIPSLVRQRLTLIPGPWELRFQTERGAPERARFPRLTSWTKNGNPGIKYFSGTAAYERPLDVPERWMASGRRIELDLGNVKNVAEVIVNGKPAGTLWKRPFRLELTGLLHPGTNRLTVRVTNLWPNRLIGDKQAKTNPIVLTTLNPYNAHSPLLDSGLLGPVQLLSIRTVPK